MTTATRRARSSPCTCRPRRRRRSRPAASTTDGRADRAAAGEEPGQGRQPEPVLQRLALVLRAGRHRRRDARDGRRQPGRHEARDARRDRARQADPRDQDDRERPQHPGRRASGAAVLGDQPRPRMGRGRAGPAAAGLVRGEQERAEDPRHPAQDRALVPADPERGRLRLHVHLRPRRRPRSCATTAAARRTTTASGARRSATTTATASAATARTASTRTATTRPSARIDEEGASNSFSSGTYRGPYPLSEPGNLAVDRLQRRVKFYGNINYHTDGQLLLTPVSYTTDYAPPDSTIFAAMTGTDGDSAVFPYQPQRSSDLYESNGDTIDNGVPELRDHRLDAGDGHLRHRRRPAELPRLLASRTTRRR